ncbi:MAG TPA: sigma factor, partial [Myxococcota bacterium]|nr:sigma factor [Myxococcota bacterium]
MTARIPHAGADDAAHVSLRDRALAGDAAALDGLVAVILPVVRYRAARVLERHPTRGGRDPQQEVDDLAQDAIAALFAGRGAALRRWEPGRGMSLRGFVGLLAERTALQVLRSRRQSPWTDDPAAPEDLVGVAGRAPGPEVEV